MDDLSGLNWSASSSSPSNKPPQQSSASPFANIRAAPPQSGNSTPLSNRAPQSSSPKPAQAQSNVDSFANLVPFSKNNSERNISLAERQRQLTAQKAAEAERQRAQIDAQFGKPEDASFWDGLEKKTASPSVQPQSRNPFSRTQVPARVLSSEVEESESDILAAFDASAPVDASSHYPVGSSARGTPVPFGRVNSPLAQTSSPAAAPTAPSVLDDDDDIFGLNKVKPAPTTTPAAHPPADQDDEDDLLGDLAKPVSAFTKPKPEPKPEEHKPSQPPRRPRSPSLSSDSEDEAPPANTESDKYVAALVDMGFPADKSRVALAATETGTDVQAAVGLLLTQAHEESRLKARGLTKRPTGEQPEARHEALPERRPRQSRESSMPSWMRDETRSPARSDRSGRGTPTSEEKDPAKIAAEFKSNFLKTANTFWKTSTKKVQQALNELNEPHEPDQPKWMREAAIRQAEADGALPPRPAPRPSKARPGPELLEVTDEARMLEPDAGRPPKPQRPRPEQSPATQAHAKQRVATPVNRTASPAEPSRQERRPRQPPRPQVPEKDMPFRPRDAPTRRDKLAVEEEAAAAYVSPARRRRGQPQRPTPETQGGLLETEAPKQPARPAKAPAPAPPKPRAAAPPPRPKAPPRKIPELSPAALSASQQLRQKGSEAYKRGDFAAAHEAYTNAISKLPQDHPIAIIILCNHALTSLKIGEPKTAIQDADKALANIGPSKGDSETIDLGQGEGTKNMKEFYGKALMRKAEALEQLERWADAAQAWRETVEAGCGGSTAIQGRNRCEKAAGISGAAGSSGTSTPSTSSARPTPAKKTAPTAVPARASPRPPPVVSTKPAEAVNRLREANQAADKADSERLALSDRVDATVNGWTAGKKDNLRALLASLDTVLWPEAGWKKISMAELIMPNKVKINYMKGIGKVHPDKIPINATTEQRMIAGAVFSTLNDAWEKFKVENNM